MKEEKIAQLNSLIKHEGWKLIQTELQRDIELTERKLFGLAPLEKEETITELQRQRLDRIELKHLPENLIREIEQPNVQPDLDAYE